VGCGSPDVIDKFADEQFYRIPEKSAGTVLDFRIRIRIKNSYLHMSMANVKISKSAWMNFQEEQFNRLDKNGDVFITRDEGRADMIDTKLRSRPVG